MSKPLQIKPLAFTLDAPDAHALGHFYAKLLGWEIGHNDDDWAWVYPPDKAQGSYPYLIMQRNPDYIPPVWPEQPGAQQQMAHMDIAVDDIEAGVAHAVQCGATIAEAQFSELWTVLLDPCGHPFCLTQRKELF